MLDGGRIAEELPFSSTSSSAGVLDDVDVRQRGDLL
jgi:hypothetical protein